MKPKKNVFYFPVDSSEQALLLRIREPDLVGRTPELLEILDQVAEARLAPADLEQAIQLLVESRQGEDLDARFDNLEARLKERIEKGLSEIEGRLSKLLARGGASDPPAGPAAADSGTPAMHEKPSLAALIAQTVPKEANLAFRIDGEVVWAKSAAQFHIAVWRWLYERGHVKPADLPIVGGNKRYVLATEPIHPSGKDFLRGQLLVPGVWIETNISRDEIFRRAKKSLDQYGVAYEVLVGSAI